MNMAALQPVAPAMTMPALQQVVPDMNMPIVLPNNLASTSQLLATLPTNVSFI